MRRADVGCLYGKFCAPPDWLSRSIAGKLATFNKLTGVSMAKPIVCLVTPADPNDQTSKSRDAFEHELSNIGWSSPSIEFHAYYGYYDKKLLKGMADKAVKKANAAPNKASTDTQNSYRIAGHQDRFKVGY